MCVDIVLGSIARRTAAWLHGMETDPNMERSWFIDDVDDPTWNRLDGLLCGVALAALRTFRPVTWAQAVTASSDARVFPCWAGLPQSRPASTSFTRPSVILCKTLGVHSGPAPELWRSLSMQVPPCSPVLHFTARLKGRFFSYGPT